MFEQSEGEHESSANTPLEAIRSAWRELNMRTQTNLLATIIKEVIFDPDAGAIVVTLVDDAAERIMTAKSDGSPTRSICAPQLRRRCYRIRQSYSSVNSRAA